VDVVRSLADVERQPLAPKGFSKAGAAPATARGQAMGPLPHALVVLLLETGLLCRHARIGRPR
jgi:hypothetical protein